MRYGLLMVGCLLGFARFASAEPAKSDAEAVTIPLKDIWAYQMPGTRDVRELDPERGRVARLDELARQSDFWKIFKALGQRPKEGEKAGSAFVVIGTGKEALKNAATILIAKEKERPTTLPPETDLSLVFYSYQGAPYVRLVSIEQSPRIITVKYQFVWHRTLMLSRHFAIIPLGKLREGTVQVKVEQLPTIDEGGKPASPMRDPLRFVSDSFSFNVRKE